MISSAGAEGLASADAGGADASTEALGDDDVAAVPQAPTTIASVAKRIRILRMSRSTSSFR